MGHTSPYEPLKIKKLKELCIKLNIMDEVIFTGKIQKDLMPDYLCNANVLCLARPNNIQAQGGFPTKLGKSLATGNPVVVTKVGEIPDYLDEQSAYLACPGSVDDFANNLKKALID